MWPSKNIGALSTCLVVIQITKDVTKRIITMMVKEVDVKVINTVTIRKVLGYSRVPNTGCLIVILFFLNGSEG